MFETDLVLVRFSRKKREIYNYIIMAVLFRFIGSDGRKAKYPCTKSYDAVFKKLRKLSQ